MNLNRRSLLKSTAIGAAAAVASPFVIRDLHAEDMIKVAGIHDTSGGLDIYGKQMVATLDLAVNEINAAGGVLGRKLELINYDSQSNIQLYSQYATEAATKEKVEVIHGGITSASREVIRPILSATTRSTSTTRSTKAASATATSSAPARCRRRRSSRWCPTCRRSGARRRLHPRRRLQLRPDHRQVDEEIRPGQGRRGGRTEFFPLDVTNFAPTIKKIQAAKPDLVWSALVGGAHIAFYRQWEATGMNKQIPLASTTFGERDRHHLRPRKTTAHRGLRLPRRLDTPANKKFVEIVHDKYRSPHMTRARDHDLSRRHLWAEAVKKAGSLDRTKVIDALEERVASTAGRQDTHRRQTHHTILDVYIGEAEGQEVRRDRVVPAAAAGRHAGGLRPPEESRTTPRSTSSRRPEPRDGARPRGGPRASSPLDDAGLGRPRSDELSVPELVDYVVILLLRSASPSPSSS